MTRTVGGVIARELGDRQERDADGPGEGDQDREHRREDGTTDEEVDQGAVRAYTTARGRIRSWWARCFPGFCWAWSLAARRRCRRGRACSATVREELRQGREEARARGRRAARGGRASASATAPAALADTLTGRHRPAEGPSGRATSASSTRCGRRWTRSCRARSSSGSASRSSWSARSSRPCTGASATCRAWPRGVGDLKRVLTNVKTRGTFGEVQLGAILEQILTPDQYGRNVRPRPDSSATVEFAVRLPGPDGGARAPVLAADRREVPARGLRPAGRGGRGGGCRGGRRRRRSRSPARCGSPRRRSARKYVAPPHTTDFAILFVPTEGLYAELLRQPGPRRVAAAGPPRDARRADDPGARS